jgi:hypothetical protein
VSGQLDAPAALLPRERAPSTHWIGGWVSPRAILDTVVKRKIPSSHRELNPRTLIVQSSDIIYRLQQEQYLSSDISKYLFLQKKKNTFLSSRVLGYADSGLFCENIKLKYMN